MRALLCRSLDGIGSLEVAEVASPSLGSGQVRIGVRASGVNFPDILMVEGKYQVKPGLPFTPPASSTFAPAIVRWRLRGGEGGTRKRSSCRARSSRRFPTPWIS